MSGLVNKVKEALHSDKSHETTQGTAGPHNSKVANSADPRVDSDRDHRANPATGTNVGGYQDPASTHVPGHTGTTTGHSGHVTGFDDPTGTHGPHGTRTANAADPRIDSDRDNRGAHHGAGGIGSTGTGYGSSNVTGYNDPTGTHGTHGSRVANAADPRIDSDRDHRSAGGATTGAGFGSTGHHAGPTGTGYGSSNVTGYNDPTGTHGPHGSRVGNAADPRVDSDRDNRAAHHGAGGIGSTAGTGYGSSNVTGYNDPTGTHGPHGSRVGNAVDPRVDSDRDNRAAHHGAGGIGSTGHHTGPSSHTTTTGTGAGYGSSHAATGYNDPTGTHGTHGSRVGNAADPRIDSDRDHRGAPGSAGTHHIGSGPGPAAHTAGPHKSDALNKVDPRVDSDLDGSKTVGGNKTYQQSGTNSLAHKDPTDASQVPPSVLREHVGEPTVAHGDHHHGRDERHQSVSHQEAHRGL